MISLPPTVVHCSCLMCVLQYCQICRKGDNEELLLLCDGCDKGCHTYCHKPKITAIPEGDWFCPACIAKVRELMNSLYVDYNEPGKVF